MSRVVSRVVAKTYSISHVLADFERVFPNRQYFAFVRTAFDVSPFLAKAIQDLLMCQVAEIRRHLRAVHESSDVIDAALRNKSYERALSECELALTQLRLARDEAVRLENSTWMVSQDTSQWFVMFDKMERKLQHHTALALKAADEATLTERV